MALAGHRRRLLLFFPPGLLLLTLGVLVLERGDFVVPIVDGGSSSGTTSPISPRPVSRPTASWLGSSLPSVDGLGGVAYGIAGYLVVKRIMRQP